MKLGMAIRELHRSENDLAGALLMVADRHRVNHEIHHVARDLAIWSREHVHELAATGQRYGVRLPDRTQRPARPLSAVVGKVSELLGRRPETGPLLLGDLRMLHRKAAGVSVDWELLAQGAQAVKDADLLALATRCHPQALRQLRWTNAMLKTLSPQVLAS